MTGTAIRLPGSDGTSWPVLTDVSVQDYWRLRSAGHEPAALLATTVGRIRLAATPPGFAADAARPEPGARGAEPGLSGARATVRARLLGQVSDAHAVGAVGVEFSTAVHRDKLPVASSLTGTGQQGWRRGRLGLPYRVSGHSDVERRGWVITMHAAGTAIRPGRPPAAGNR